MMNKLPDDYDIEALLSGDVRAASRLIRRIEDGDPAIRPALKTLYRRGGSARVIALTGPPGVGKSTLADQLIGAYRAEGKRVAVLAVDPTSPFTGGAILGDRIRMGRHFADEGVFIRSMAARGHPGGLARATGEAAIVLDAMGWDIVLIETVGVGQAEIEAVYLAETVVLALAPGEGDDIQAAKAGIMEIAHIFVVNKARREGADTAVNLIEESLNQRAGGGGDEEDWRPPVLKCEALAGEGIEEIIRALGERRDFLDAHPRAAQNLRRAHARQLLAETFRALASERYASAREGEPAFEALLAAIAAREEDPYTAAERLLGTGGPGQGI